MSVQMFQFSVQFNNFSFPISNLHMILGQIMANYVDSHQNAPSLQNMTKD